MKKFVYWFLSLTWGLPLTLIGFIVAVPFLLKGCKLKAFGWTFYLEVNTYEGSGFSIGAIFFVPANCSLHMRQHEHGHGIQNTFLGVFMPFVVTIPSVIRFWYREYLVKKKGVKYADLKPYESVWFEKQATSLGEKHFSV